MKSVIDRRIDNENLCKNLKNDGRQVAENFEKEHKNVLQTIQNLAAENSAANLFIKAENCAVIFCSSYENFIEFGT